MSERKLAKGWLETILAGPGGPACAIHFRVIYNHAKHHEWYPAALAPDKCFAKEPEFKTGDWVANKYSKAFGRVIAIRSAGNELRVQHALDVPGGWRPHSDYELIQRGNPCGK